MSTALDTMLVRTPGTCGGRLRIDGSRITVERIAVLYKQGHSAEEVASDYPHLSLASIYAALAYYHANRDEVDAALAAEDALYDELKKQSQAADQRP